MVVGIFQAGFDFYPIVGFVVFTAINTSPDIEFALYGYIGVFYACFLMPVMLFPIVSREILSTYPSHLFTHIIYITYIPILAVAVRFTYIHLNTILTYILITSHYILYLYYMYPISHYI